MRLEIEKGRAGRHHWRLVVTSADLARDERRLDRRLRVIGGGVRAELDDAAAGLANGSTAGGGGAPRSPRAPRRAIARRALTTGGAPTEGFMMGRFFGRPQRRSGRIVAADPGAPLDGGPDSDQVAENEVRRDASEAEHQQDLVANEARRQASESRARLQATENEARRLASEDRDRRRVAENEVDRQAAERRAHAQAVENLNVHRADLDRRGA